MKRFLAAIAMVGVLVGCKSTPEEQKPAQVEDRGPTAAVTPPPPTTKGPTTGPVKPETVGGDELNNPGSILSRRSIFFDYDQYTVKEEFKPVVSAHANYLAKNSGRRMTIQGNTDERGSREYNLALGQRRADAVKQMMTLLGAPSASIETVSFGEEKPRGQGQTEQAFAENRRADIVYDRE